MASHGYTRLGGPMNAFMSKGLIYPLMPLLAMTRRYSVFICLLVAASLIYLSLVVTREREGGHGNHVVSSFPTKPRFSLDEMRRFALRKSLSTDYKPSYYTSPATTFERLLAEPESRFDMSQRDVLIFVHIQKTAGTSFEKYLVHNLDVEHPCECRKGRKRCVCKRPGRNETWLFSRYSTGWVCGLHADFTELAVSSCVDTVLNKKEGSSSRRRYFYTSFLRDPITRLVSEFRHVSRGATWLASRHMCNGRPPSPEELPMCFDPRHGWEGVSLAEFLACPYNLAFNRQTRMLADLTLVDCYDSTKMSPQRRDAILLESAKANLRSLSFFGLKEAMGDSQWMFEALFGMRFNKPLADWGKSKSNDTVLTHEIIQRIKEVNNLDIELYDYAYTLFRQRLERMKEEGVGKLQPTFAPVHRATDAEGDDDIRVRSYPDDELDSNEDDDRYEQDSEKYR